MGLLTFGYTHLALQEDLYKMKSVYSSRYPVIDVASLPSVRARVAAIEGNLPSPRTEEEARRRVIVGLYAIGKMSCMLMEQLDEDAEFAEDEDEDGYPRDASPQDRMNYWSKLCAELESRFQGNLVPLLARKAAHQKKLMKRRR